MCPGWERRSATDLTEGGSRDVPGRQRRGQAPGRRGLACCLYDGARSRCGQSGRLGVLGCRTVVLFVILAMVGSLLTGCDGAHSAHHPSATPSAVDERGYGCPASGAAGPAVPPSDPRHASRDRQ